MKKLLFSLFLLCAIASNINAQIFLNWQHFTDGTSHSDDSAVAVDVEETATNVYVGGNIYNTGKGSDIIIQNFDLNGNLLWSSGYSSALNDHLAWFLCNESPGAIYGAGNSDNGTNLNGLLIKMDMSGNLLWSKTFNGTGNTMFENVKIAPNGNIIVVGKIVTSQITCNGMIVAYDEFGNLLWSQILAGQSGESEFNHLEFDANGNIYASGKIYNGSNEDGFIESFKPNGTPLNTININGAGNKDDEVKGIRLKNDTLYAVTVGRGSGSYNEATTTAYASRDFSLIWTKNYSSVNGDAYIIGPEINETTGDIMLAGCQDNLSGTSDYLALSYNGITGNLNWAKTTSRGAGYNNIATAFALNAYGDLLITGSANLAGAAVDMFTVQFDATGNLLWSKVFNDAVNGDDYPTSIGADANGNIFVGGTSTQSQTLAPAKNNLDFTLLKYSSNFICSVPTNLFTDNISNSKAIVHWDVMPEALKYKVQYRITGSGTWTSVNANTNSYTLTGLVSNTRYQWRVKTICSNNPTVSSDYSAINKFKTLAGAFSEISINKAAEETDVKQAGLQLFPNPATQMVNLQLNNINESNVDVKLYDLTGKELKHYQFVINSKIFNHQIDVSFLSPGSYIIEIFGSKQKWSQVLIKQ